MNPPREAYIIHDGQTIIEASPEFCELFHCDALALVDARVELIVSGDDLKALARLRAKHIIKIIETEPEHEFRQEYEFRRCDGSRFWGMAETRRYDEDRRLITFIIWKYDIHS